MKFLLPGLNKLLKIMLVCTSMQKMKEGHIFTQLRKIGVAGFVVFFVVFSFFASIYTLNVLNKSFVFENDNSLTSISFSYHSDQKPTQTDSEDSIPMQPLVEEELEHQVTADDGYKLLKTEIVYSNLVHDHFYLNSSVHAGYGQPLFRPPVIS